MLIPNLKKEKHVYTENDWKEVLKRQDLLKKELLLRGHKYNTDLISEISGIEGLEVSDFDKFAIYSKLDELKKKNIRVMEILIKPIPKLNL